MENAFEEIYQAHKALDKAFEGKAAGDAVAVNFRISTARLCEKGPVFDAVYRQYEKSRDNGNENLDFNDYILDVGEYADCLRENGVKCFTMSNCYLGAIAKAMGFQKAGYRVTGIKEIKGRINPWSEKRETLPALVFEISSEEEGEQK